MNRKVEVDALSFVTLFIVFRDRSSLLEIVECVNIHPLVLSLYSHMQKCQNTRPCLGKSEKGKLSLHLIKHQTIKKCGRRRRMRRRRRV
jgi:hypothetical protein